MICTIQSFAEWYTAHAPWPPRAARVIGGTSAPDSKPITGGGGQSIAQTRAALVRLVYYQPSITLSYKERHFNECPLLVYLGSLAVRTAACGDQSALIAAISLVTSSDAAG